LLSGGGDGDDGDRLRIHSDKQRTTRKLRVSLVKLKLFSKLV